MLTRARQVGLTRGTDGKEAGKNYRVRTMFHVFLFFIICTFSEQAQVTLQVRISVSDLV